MNLAAASVGKTFGKLTVLGASEGFMCRCACACGNECEVYVYNLTKGLVKSCGCYRRQFTTAKNTRHGDATANKAAEYRVWRAMISRCENPNVKDFRHYGGRGISVCARWRRDYLTFLADMGRRPSPAHSIDRYPNNDGNYEPGNCRWATSKQQRANQRSKEGTTA